MEVERILDVETLSPMEGDIRGSSSQESIGRIKSFLESKITLRHSTE